MYSGADYHHLGLKTNFSLFALFNRSNVSQVLTFLLDSQPTSVLCHMGDFGCGDGGWTPVMKIDGNNVLYFYFLFFLYVISLFGFYLYFKF